MIKDPFRTDLSRNIFRNKYAQGSNDSWRNLAIRLVDDVCGTMGGKSHPILSREERSTLVEYIDRMLFIPGGRYLYYAGRPLHAWNNCAAYETKLLTDRGWVRMGDVAGRYVNVLSPVDGKYYPAKVHNHGQQPLNKITFKPLRGRSNVEYVCRFTENHKWLLKNGETTTKLAIGDVVPASAIDLDKDDLGFAHGFVFGDGTAKGQLRLCAAKDLAHLDRLRKVAKTVTYPDFADGDPLLYFNNPVKWKEPPPSTATPEYIASFLKGWIAADGCENRMIHSISKKNLEWFVEHAAYAGLVISGEIGSQVRDITIGDYEYKNHTIHKVHFSRGEAWQGFKVTSIEPSGIEDVYCPFEPVHNQIVVDHNIHTYQCFLLKAEEDTREEWANLLWRASSCLMLGGGIGIDYSLLRPSGRSLSRTGGVSSGPVPLMCMVNEVGRNIMQGGSRRSAIYASLNWQHEDVEQFLRIKNWDTLQIAGSGMTYAEVKQKDFNYPCPLDMTNISVNYDDAALEGLATNQVFEENCLQAMRTGEPGFSFNFGDKQNETLRNAPVAGDTQVLTQGGYRSVRDLVDEDVYVWTGKQYARTTFVRTKSMTKTVRVNMTGGRSIVCDPDHPFLVESWVGRGRRRKLERIGRFPAKDLVLGDILHVSLPGVNPQPFDTSDYTLGYMYGDGHFRKSGGGGISLCSEESKALLPYLDKNMFSSVNENDGRGFVRCYVKSKATPWRDKASYPLYEDLSPSFIAGLFDADGSYDAPPHRIRLASVHRSFLEGCQRHLESLGILASINRGGKSTYGQQEGWLLVVMSDYVNKFLELIPTKRLRPEEHRSYRKSQIKVLNVVSDVDQDVFCCDVGVEEHAFQANGVIISNCTEVTSEDDSDVCNLGSIHIGNIGSLGEFKDVVTLASKFLVCGTVRADLPYKKVGLVREKNRRLGLGLMGIHEWLLKRQSRYEVTPELHKWLEVYRDESVRSANEHCDRLYLSRPVAYRAIAPTGTIGILAGTTTGIEPLFAVAYKRRYLTDGTKWKYEYVIDHTADLLIREYGLNPENIDTAYSMAGDYERRIKFQADVQDYVDMSISSTINLPAWGSPTNNPGTIGLFSGTLAKYAPRLRGFTCYPDGSRGGQPITEVEYSEALKHKGVVYVENDPCSGGVCGI